LDRSVIDRRASRKRTREKATVLCESCDEPKPASFWCEFCPAHLCDECNTSEHLSKLTSKHRRIPFTSNTIIPNYPKCTKHHNQDESFYCQDDKKFYCSVCVIDLGKKVVKAEQHGDAIKQDLVKCLEPLNQCKWLDDSKKHLEGELQKSQDRLIETEKLILLLQDDIKQKREAINEVHEINEKVVTTRALLNRVIKEIPLLELIDQTKSQNARKRIEGFVQKAIPEDKSKQLKVEKEKEELKLGRDFRTGMKGPDQWNDRSKSNNENSITIPAGWRLAKIDEAVLAAKAGACFGTNVLIHEGALLSDTNNAVHTLNYPPAGQLFSYGGGNFRATDGGRSGSTLSMGSGTKAFLLVRDPL